MWTDIPGYEGKYQVSADGQVQSLMQKMPRILKQFTHTRYKAVALQGRHFYVHQLVLLAFVGPCPDGMEVCHNDGDSHNNHLINLRYDTRSANTLDKVKHGTHTNAAKTHCLRGHEYTPENTFIHRGSRSCRECRRAVVREYKKSKKSKPDH